MEHELTEDLINEIDDSAKKQDKDFILKTFDSYHAADISRVLDELDSEECKYILSILRTETSAELIKNLESDVRIRFLKNYSSEELAPFINVLDSDDAVDILQEQHIKIREEVIMLLQNREKARHILDLLRYEEDSAGGLMAKELIKANINWTVSQCIEDIRRQTKYVNKIYTVYVTDNAGILLGRVSLKEIILAGDETKIEDIYKPEILSVYTYDHEEEVAEMMRRYDLEVLPVVNVEFKLVGRVTIDDIVDVMQEQAEQERQMMAGISSDAEEDDSIWRLSKARLPWLFVGMAGGLFGARIIGLFEADLAIVPAMAFFIPLITATGGNVGIQSSTLMVQSLAKNSYSSASWFKRFLKLFVLALLNGVVIALVAFGFNYVMGNSFNLNMVVSIALLSVVLLSSLLGTVTPLVLDKIGINPALASGPFITTSNDIIGLGVYFFVAHQLLSL